MDVCQRFYAATFWWVLVAGIAQDRGVSGLVLIPADSSSVRLVGRFDRRTEDRAARFDMNGFEIQFQVAGATRVEAKLAQRMSAYVPGPLQPSGFQVNDFVVFIDGVAQISPAKGSNCSYCTFDTSQASNNTAENYVLADGLSSGVHDIRLFKATEPQWVARDPAPNWMTFHGLTLDTGVVLAPAKARPVRRLEFVGDSITAGYCNLCSGPAKLPETTVRQLSVSGLEYASSVTDGNGMRRRRAAEGGPWEETFALGWPTRICAALGAECHTAAWSGFGMIENCCGGSTTMPEIWRRAVATDVTSQWDFSSWVPHGLVINLGTNDNVWARNASYSETYFEMVMNASKAYGPDLNVFLACGPMENDLIVYCPYVEQIVARAVAAGVKAHFLDQRGFLDAGHGPSCCGHPGAEVDGVIAEKGGKFISQALGWSSQADAMQDTAAQDMSQEKMQEQARLSPFFAVPIQSQLALSKVVPDMAPFNMMLSAAIPSLNRKLHERSLPASLGNCSAGVPAKAPLPCSGSKDLYSMHKPWEYKVVLRWVTGLSSLNFTAANLKWNATSSGVSLSLSGLFKDLSASISIAECATLDHCKIIWDNTDACCGKNKHFEIDLAAFCSPRGGVINRLDVSAVKLDKFDISESIMGFKINVDDITKTLESTILNMLKKELAKVSFPLIALLNSNANARRMEAALCQNSISAASACQSAVMSSPLEAKALMFFATGKQFYDQGAFTVCKEIPRHTGLTNFSTKHFTVSYTVAGIPGELGLCLPATCKNEDIPHMLEYLLAKEPLTSLAELAIPSYHLGYPQPKGTLRHPNPVNDIDDTIKWSDPGGSPILTPLACGIIAALVFLAGWSTYVTSLDIRRRHDADALAESGALQHSDAEPRVVGFANMKVVRAFSLIGPDGTWTSLWQRGSYRPTDCLNGLRVISMLWIVLGHSFLITGGCAGYFNGQDVVKNVLNPDAAMTNPMWSLLDMPGLDLAVDTFFFISGFLASYVGSTRETPFFKGALLRYIRLAPCLAFVLMIYTLILPFMASGPFAPRFQNAIFRRCHAWTWWTPLLFIMNFLPWYNDDVCMGWTWYLGNDMIFAIIGIALLNLWKWGPRSGWAMTIAITVASFVVTFSIIWQYKLAILDDPTTPHGSDYQYYLYDKPWSRIPAFLVGFVVPWVLLWAKRVHGLDRGTQPKSAAAFFAVGVAFWAAIGVILFLLFIAYSDQAGGFGSTRVESNWTTLENGIYLTFGRPLWVCAHIVITLACYFDYVPLANGFLSHHLWAPLTKLTYNAYLLHPLMINLRCGNAVQYYQFTWWTLFQNLVIDAGLAYAAAAVTWCLVEKPVTTLTGFLIAKPSRKQALPESTFAAGLPLVAPQATAR